MNHAGKLGRAANGYTLIELMIVLVIIGILSSITIAAGMALIRKILGS